MRDYLVQGFKGKDYIIFLLRVYLEWTNGRIIFASEELNVYFHRFFVIVHGEWVNGIIDNGATYRDWKRQ